MFKLLKAASQQLREMQSKWCFCGGWAIDLFVGQETRPHKDLDIMIFKEDLPETLNYLKSRGWRIEAPTRKGFLPVDSENFGSFDYDNLWCMNEQYPLDYLKIDECSSYNFYHYEREVQEDVDFVEILLNQEFNGYFVYKHNPDIKLALDKVFYDFEGLPYLAPEIVLLNKSKYLSVDNQNDFDTVLPRMTVSQKGWLLDALISEYGNDHPWVELLQMDRNQSK